VSRAGGKVAGADTATRRRTGDITGTVKQYGPGDGVGTYPAMSPGELDALHHRITIRNLW
jgi:hypothetical protein